jgi:hypothetical protein
MKLSKTKSFVLVAVMTASSAALAQDPPPEGTQPPPPPPARVSSSTGMGAQGQIALAADLPLLTSSPLFSVVRTSSSFMGTSSSGTTIVIAPSGDYFIAPNVSVGALVGFANGPTGVGDVTTFGLMPRAGYSLSLTDVLSIWPRLGIGYFYTSVSPTGGGGSFSGYTIPFFVEVPVLWHPAPHFFIGAGPTLKTELVNKGENAAGMTADGPKTTDLGITTMIGGYFGG